MQYRRRSAGSLAKTAALLFFVGLLFADGVVAYFLIRDRLGTYFPTQPILYFPLIVRENPLGDPTNLPPTPNPTATSTPQPAAKTYIVKSGDTISQIADDLGVSVEDLVNANHLSDKNVIQVGDELIIPSSTGATVTPGPSPTPNP